MKKEIADKWVEALRSGRYKQCKSWLRDNDGFCCLGVLCDISKMSAWGELENTPNIMTAHIKLFLIRSWNGLGCVQ